MAHKYSSMKSEIEIKTDRLVKMLDAENLGGVLLNSQANFAWLTGGKSNFINLSAEIGACSLLVRRDGQKFVLANNIEMPRLLSEEISGADFEPIKYSWQAEKTDSDLIAEKAKSVLAEGAAIISDLMVSKKIEPAENLIARCRFELTGAEIERFKLLGKDAGIALGNVIKSINQGETELQIAGKTQAELAKFNINCVVALIAADERIGNFRHPIPTGKVWKKTLLLVVCAKREGLIASLSRIVCIGKIPDELRRKTEASGYVFARILAATKRGATGAEIYQTAAQAYAEKGFADELNNHHQGGAAGYQTRDWIIHPKCAETVFPNQAFAFNPSITGTKTEETAILINNEIEIITATPDFPSIETEIAGKIYHQPGILTV